MQIKIDVYCAHSVSIKILPIKLRVCLAFLASSPTEQHKPNASNALPILFQKKKIEQHRVHCVPRVEQHQHWVAFRARRARLENLYMHPKSALNVQLVSNRTRKTQKVASNVGLVNSVLKDPAPVSFVILENFNPKQEHPAKTVP